ncbi:MAG TPA: Nif3-like dinuclear metal center hexameric protein [Cyclobacteriaceae bacterium]|nr:Nif3-like dinuclear metal center hexameric protein [Cyclobacteriaceae bacterium]
MITIGDVVRYLDDLAPPAYQEDYDNSGLLTGDPLLSVTSVLVTLDCTEEVVHEAIGLGANMIIAHHPIIFRGLKKLTGRNYVERTVIKAIKHDIAIFAIHTNLDNVYSGVNRKIAEQIGLKNLKILQPKKETLAKLVTFIPKENAEAVLAALHEAGAGNIGNYKNCSFTVEGTGTFMPTGDADPLVGETGVQEKVNEVRAELIFPVYRKDRVLEALRASHPYEEVAYYIQELVNENQDAGSGMVGDLEVEEEPIEFLQRLKISMHTNCVRHTPVVRPVVKRVAVCGGSGSFLLSAAIRSGADVFVSADFKYHEFFDSDGKIIIADIGHYESEQFTKELISEILREKFRTFAINFSKTVTNPIRYL